jgi:hypothetical protein
MCPGLLSIGACPASHSHQVERTSLVGVGLAAVRCHSGLMADKFPSDFYVTCATVIPVLFLAVAVQGRTFESILRAYRTADQASAEDIAQRLRDAQSRGDSRREWAKQVRTNRWGSEHIKSSFSILTASFIVGAGTVGEVIALLTLYRVSEVTDGRFIVLVATLILVAAVAAGPFWASLQPSDAPLLPPPPGSITIQRTTPSEAEAADHQPGEPGPDDGTEP